MKREGNPVMVVVTEYGNNTAATVIQRWWCKIRRIFHEKMLALCHSHRQVIDLIRQDEKAENNPVWRAWNSRRVREIEAALKRHRIEFTLELNHQLLRSFPTRTPAERRLIRAIVLKNIRAFWTERDGCEEPFNGLQQVLHHGFSHDYRNILREGIQDTPLSRV